MHVQLAELDTVMNPVVVHSEMLGLAVALGVLCKIDHGIIVAVKQVGSILR